MEKCEQNPEGPRRFRTTGQHRFHPFRYTNLKLVKLEIIAEMEIKLIQLALFNFRYKHFAQFAPLGGEQTAAQLPGDWVSIGHSTQWLWYSVYAR